MSSGPIISWRIEGEKREAVTDFLFLGPKITSDGDCKPWNLKMIASQQESYDKPRQYVVHIVKVMVFPVVMYGCENWTINKADC